MAKTVGLVKSVAINPERVTFFLKLGEQPEKKLVLFADEANTAIVPQLTLASRSWMLALLQSALSNRLPVVADHDDQSRVKALRVFDEGGLDFNFNFDFESGSPKRRKPSKDTPRPSRRPQPA